MWCRCFERVSLLSCAAPHSCSSRKGGRSCCSTSRRGLSCLMLSQRRVTRPCAQQRVAPWEARPTMRLRFSMMIGEIRTMALHLKTLGKRVSRGVTTVIPGWWVAVTKIRTIYLSHGQLRTDAGGRQVACWNLQLTSRICRFTCLSVATLPCPVPCCLTPRY